MAGPETSHLASLWFCKAKLMWCPVGQHLWELVQVFINHADNLVLCLNTRCCVVNVSVCSFVSQWNSNEYAVFILSAEFSCTCFVFTDEQFLKNLPPGFCFQDNALKVSGSYFMSAAMHFWNSVAGDLDLNSVLLGLPHLCCRSWGVSCTKQE